jgi:hypothetical protein
MMKMTKKVFSRVLWLGRGTATTMGVAVMLAVVLGVGTTALAAVPGDPFKLGRTNSIDVMSTLVGSASGTLLRITNNGSGPALDLRVEEGEAPMNVNSTARVNGLNADQIDGKDFTAFVPTDSYVVLDLGSGEGGGSIGSRTALCDRGDALLGGGFDSSVDDSVIASAPTVSTRNGWSIRFQDNGPSTGIMATALCADLPPLRP